MEDFEGSQSGHMRDLVHTHCNLENPYGAGLLLRQFSCIVILHCVNVLNPAPPFLLSMFLLFSRIYLSIYLFILSHKSDIIENLKIVMRLNLPKVSLSGFLFLL